MSRVSTKGPKVACPEATVETMNVGTPKGRALIAAVPILVPWAPPMAITPEIRPLS